MRKMLFSVMVAGLAAIGVQAENVIPPLNFQAPKGWYLPPGHTILPLGGKFGDQVLEIKRKNKSDYHIASYVLDIKRFKRNCTYRFGGWLATDGEAGGQLAVEFMHAGKYLSGFYLDGGSPTEWKWIERSFEIPEGADAIQLSVFMSRNYSGTVRFCDFLVEVVEQPPKLYTFLKSPCPRPLPKAGEQEIVFALKILNAPDKPLQYRILDGTGKIAAQGKFDQKQTELKAQIKLTVGVNKLTLRIVDTDGKTVAKGMRQVMVSAGTDKPRPGCIIDEYGRAWIDGKKFMPLGLYCNSGKDRRLRQMPGDDEVLRIIAHSPFNCVIDYSATEWQGSKASSDPLAAMLDQYQAFGLKAIIPTTWLNIENSVPKLRNHPALLAYYTADEISPDEAAKIVAVRERLNELDPRHPTWAVYCYNNTTYQYAPTCDIYGYDPYPILKGGESLDEMVDSLEKITGVLGSQFPFWAVPQFFNNGNYMAEKDLKRWQRDFKAPTEDEMTSICFIEAIMGAKGFVGYSFFDLFSGPSDPQRQFKERWPMICRVGETMKKAEPFIMGDGLSYRWPVKAVSGKIMARIFTADDGRRAVMIATPTATGATAEIELEKAAGFKSLRGSCKLQNGKWRFAASRVNCDLLYEGKR